MAPQKALPLADARKHWASWQETLEGFAADDLSAANDLCSSATPGAVKAEYANRYWIPFAYDYGGNHLGVDLDPAERGTFGQVINFGRDEEEKFVVADSVSSFLEWLVDQLEGGNAAIREEDDDGRSLNTRQPEKFHFLDSVRVMFASHAPQASAGE